MAGKEFESSRKFKGRGQGPKQKKKSKLPSIKNQIRGVQRLLAKEGLDAKVRQKQEERLAELLLAKEQHEKAERERKYAKRYHKVRFFERVKIERHLHKLQKQQVPGQQLTLEEQSQLEQLKEDLQYVLHFPKGEKYVSLLKDAAEPEEQARLASERARLRALVRQQLVEEALVTEADEGRSLARENAPAAAAGAAASKGGGGRGGSDESEEGEGVVDDDDFFLHSSDGEEEEEEEEDQQQQQQQQQRYSNEESWQEGPEDEHEELGEASSGASLDSGSSDKDSDGLAVAAAAAASLGGRRQQQARPPGGVRLGPASAARPAAAKDVQPSKMLATNGAQGEGRLLQQRLGEKPGVLGAGAPAAAKRPGKQGVDTAQLRQGAGGQPGSKQQLQQEGAEPDRKHAERNAQGQQHKRGSGGTQGAGRSQPLLRLPQRHKPQGAQGKALVGGADRLPAAAADGAAAPRGSVAQQQAKPRPQQRSKGGGAAKGKRGRPGAAVEKQPLRSRSEGGRKRRKKSKD